MDYLKELNELALGSRLKRMSDTIMREVMRIYEGSRIDFEPYLMPAFNYLCRNEEAGITQIATALSLSQPAVSQFVSTLAAKGYVKLIVDKVDTRKRIVQLTPKGKNLHKELQPIWGVIETEVKLVLQEPERNLMLALNDFEEHFNKINFSERVLKKLKPDESQVQVVGYNDKYKKDLQRLNYEWLEKYFSVEPSDVVSLANPKKEIIDKGGFAFFALSGNEVVGTASLLKGENKVFELGKMAVTGNQQGKKVGQKLMDACLKKAKELKLNSVILYSNSKLAPALNLYFKNGFKVVSMERAPYKRSNIKMELRLN